MTSQTPFVGPANQTPVPATVHNLPSTIAPNSSVTSNLIVASGYAKAAAGLTSSQAGVLSIQRFLDANGAVRIGNPDTVAIVAGTPVALASADDGQIFGSFQVIIENDASATALIANLAVAVASDPDTVDGPSTGSYQTATPVSVPVPSTAGGIVLYPANPNAVYRLFRNPRTNNAAVWLGFGANPQVGLGYDLQPGESFEMSAAAGNLYQELITAIAETDTQTILTIEGTQS